MMSDRVIEVDVITVTGSRQTFRCAEILTIDGSTLAEITRSSSAVDLDELRDAVIMLQGRMDEMGSQMTHFAFRHELNDQINGINIALRGN